MSIEKDTSVKKRRYRKNNNYNVDFKFYEYKLADTKTISEEIAEECTNIEKKGGEVLSIIYNTYPLLNNKVYSNFLKNDTEKKNNKYIKKKKEKDEEEKDEDEDEDKDKDENEEESEEESDIEEDDEEYHKDTKRVKDKDKDKDNDSINSKIHKIEEELSFLDHLKKYSLKNELKKKSVKKKSVIKKKKSVIKKKKPTFFSYLKDGIINSAMHSDVTVVYIIYSLNAVSIKKPRKFDVYVEKVNSFNSNITLGNIAVGQRNKLLLKEYNHFCTLIDSYTSMKGFGNSYGNEIINIITFYTK